jgi:hypothetical protein
MHEKIRKLQKDHASEIKKNLQMAAKKYQEENKETISANKRMRSELAKLEKFNQKRFLMASQLENTKHELGIAKHKHKEEIREMERTFLQVKERMQKDVEQKIALFKGECRSMLQKEMDSESQRLRIVNRQACDELRFHVKTNNSLRAMNEKNKGIIKQLRMELDLAKQKDKLQTIRGVKNDEKIRKLKLKKEDLEDHVVSLKQEVGYSRRELLARKEAHERDEELATVRRQLTLRTKDFQRIRKLARKVLDQRNEVERFFLTALEQVKQEVKAKREREYKMRKKLQQQRLNALTRGVGNLPPMGLKRTGPEEPPPKQRVDLNDLGPEERERVLRLLFSKINNAASDAVEKANSPVVRQNVESEPVFEEHEEETGGDNTFLTNYGKDED